MENRRQAILAAIHDSVLDFVNYDREDDEELKLGDIQDAIKNKEISLAEMIDYFAANLEIFLEQ